MSFTELYDSSFSAVWRYAASQGIRGTDLEDVVQEVFLVAYQRLDTFEGRSAPRTWVIGIALNVVRAFRRRKATRSLGEPLVDFPEPRARDPLATSVLETQEETRFLFEILEKMPETQREAFVLCEIEELSAVEVAGMLELNENTLRTRLRAARRAVNDAVARRAKQLR